MRVCTCLCLHIRAQSGTHINITYTLCVLLITSLGAGAEVFVACQYTALPSAPSLPPLPALLAPPLASLPAHIDMSSGSSVVMKPFAKDYANLPLIVHTHSRTHTLTHTHAHWHKAFIYIYIRLTEDLRFIIIYAA